MKRRIAVFDTSLYCCWLRVPGKETAGSPPTLWDFAKVDATITQMLRSGISIVLPLATIIEIGNHIAQANHDRFRHATNLCNHIREALEARTPWVPFLDQSAFWTTEQMLLIVNQWPKLAETHISFGDITIKPVVDYYAAANFDVTILTADEHLRSYEPPKPNDLPRRRK